MALDGVPQCIGQCLATAPREVEARDGVAVPVDASLGPVDDREEAHAITLEPLAYFVAGAGDVGLCPSPRPLVVVPELGDPQPVLEGQLSAVADPRSPLLRGVGHEHAAERLARQPPDLVGVTAVDEQQSAVATRIVLEQLERGHQAGDPCPHHHHLIPLAPRHRA